MRTTLLLHLESKACYVLYVSWRVEGWGRWVRGREDGNGKMRRGRGMRMIETRMSARRRG